MKPERNESSSRRDHALLRKILLKLTATSKILASALVVVVVLLWYAALNRLLAFGTGIGYAGSRLGGAAATALLDRKSVVYGKDVGRCGGCGIQSISTQEPQRR